MVSKRSRWALSALLLGVAAAGGLAVHADHRTRKWLPCTRERVDPAQRSRLGPEATDVAFRTRDGLLLRGWYVPSRNGAAVLLAHGADANRTAMLPEGKALAEAGFGVLLFDFRAHGDSEGASCSRGHAEQQDVRAALDWLTPRPDVADGRVGALAFSMGARAVVAVAAEDARVRALVVEGCSASLLEALKRDLGGLPLVTGWVGALRLSRERIDPDAVNPTRQIASIAPRPLLMVHGTADRVVPTPVAEQLFARAKGPKRMVRIHGASHGTYARDGGEAYVRELVAFFQDALPHPGEAATSHDLRASETR